MEKKMIKRLIFDIDETLITDVTFDEAIKGTLQEYGLIYEDDLQKFKYGISTYENEHCRYEEKEYLRHFSKILGKQLNEKFLYIHFNNLLIHAIPDYNKELINTIDKLSRKYELVLLSNYFEESQRNRLEKIGINNYFTEYYGEKISKPHKQAFIDAIRKT